jgi:myosin-9
LAQLVDDDHPVPAIIETLLLIVELRGLFVEGLYRKSGSIAQMKQMRKLIETTSGVFSLMCTLNTYLCADASRLRFDDIPVHVLTGLVKAFFREMAEPLLTFDLYENFLNVSGVWVLEMSDLSVLQKCNNRWNSYGVCMSWSSYCPRRTRHS